MVASPANRIIARVFGGVVICDDTAAGPASYDVHGLRFVFVPAVGDTATYAVDVEHRETAIPAMLEQRIGPSFAQDCASFFEGWTRLEVIAKLSGHPVLELVRAVNGKFSDLPEAGISIQRVDTSTHWIAVGQSRSLG